MKKIILGVVLLCVPLQSIFASTVVRSGDNVTVAENQSVEGGFYAMAGTVALHGVMSDDVTIVAGNVLIEGEIRQDLGILAGTVDLKSRSADDVRVVAGRVTVSGDISGNLVVVAGQLTILPEANVEGDILFYGEEAIIQGKVGGKVLGSVQFLKIDSEVSGGVNVTASRIELGPTARIVGGVSYTSSMELVQDKESVIEGEVVHNDVSSENSTFREFARIIAVFFLVLLFSTLSLYLMTRTFVFAFSKQSTNKFLLNIIVGSLAVISLPLVAVVLCTTVFGIVLGTAILGLYMLLMALTIALMPVYVGSLVSLWSDKQVKFTLPYGLLGVVLVTLFVVIPVIGWLLFTAAFFVTLGAMLVGLYRFME